MCRPYTKGRDWFDFVWYVSRKIVPNYVHLKEALFQIGPWQGQDIAVDGNWLVAGLRDKIATTDWQEARRDTENFLRAQEREGLAVWGNEFFLATVQKMSDYINSVN